MERHTHYVTTVDDVDVPFDLYQRQPSCGALIILCPGFWQSKESAIMRRIAWTLADRADVACVDFRGHGASCAFYTFSAKEHLDLEAVLAWARARYPRIAVIGFSLGGAIALNAAARSSGIRTIVTVGSPSAFDDVEFHWWRPEAIRSGLRSLHPGAGCRPAWPWHRKIRPIDSLAALAGTPLLFMHGTRDPIVSHRHSERLYAAAHEPKQLALIERGGHAEHLFRQDPGRFLALVREWLDATLEPRSPSAPPPAQAEGFLTVRPGTALYYHAWTGGAQAAPLVIVHGAGEHSGRYEALAERLVRAGFAVWAFDLEGHGRSPGARGHIRRFSRYVESVQAVVAQAAQAHGGRAPVLLGHSLGGLIATHYAAQAPQTIAALALSSPLWGLALQVPWWKRAAARCLSPVWPSLTMPRGLGQAPLISHDPEVVRRYLTDPRMHYVASTRLYTEIQRAVAALPGALPRITVPTLVQQAGDDVIASPEAVRRLVPRLGARDATLTVYEGYYHEIFNEVERERPIADLVAWLQAHRA